MILDFHAHIYPDSLAQRVIENTKKLGVTSYVDGTGPSLLDSMKTAGIDWSVILNIATKPGQFDHVFDFARATMDTPGLIPFASIHPRDEDWKGELRRVKEAGFAGVKLHPDYQGFFIDEPFLEPIYREIASLGLILVFHAGLDVVSPDVIHASARRIANVLPLLELGTTVLAHMGGIFEWEEVLALICGKGVYLDTSFTLLPEAVEIMRKMVRKHGTERILFGTDSPWLDQKHCVDVFRDSFAKGFLSEEDTAAILSGNGLTLLDSYITKRGLPL